EEHAGANHHRRRRGGHHPLTSRQPASTPGREGGRAMPRAIRLYQTGGPEVLRWEEVEVGEPAAGQARVRHTAVGVNFVDTYHRSGLYPLPLPGGLGSEGAGVVEAVGPGVGHVRPGDRVAYAGGSPGSYAAVRLMPADRLLQLPDR